MVEPGSVVVDPGTVVVVPGVVVVVVLGSVVDEIGGVPLEGGSVELGAGVVVVVVALGTVVVVEGVKFGVVVTERGFWYPGELIVKAPDDVITGSKPMFVDRFRFSMINTLISGLALTPVAVTSAGTVPP